MPHSERAKFQILLKELRVARVLCIDDVYESRSSVEEILGWSAAPGNRRALSGILKSFGHELDLDSNTAIAELRTLLDDTRTANAIQASIDRQQLKNPASLDDNNTQILTDRSVLSRLDEIMEGFIGFDQLTPAEWTSNKASILQSLSDTRMLFLFDENLGDGFKKGTDYIREIAESDHCGNALLGLLSYTIISGSEHEVTRRLQHENIAATAIAKRDLQSEVGIQQLQSKLRAAVLWRESMDLRKKCRRRLTDACTDAYKRVQDLDPLEFDEVVFLSSSKEGVHEMDTLIRIYTNAFAASLREALRSDSRALEYIDKLRSYRSTDDRGDSKEQGVSRGSTAWKLQREEYYDSGAYINSCMMATEAGDIYEIESKDEPDREFVLVAPPCDLVLRSSGSRKQGVETGVLCEIVKSEPDENGRIGTFQLDCYSQSDGSSAWVRFAAAVTIDLRILDLCAIDSCGQAIILLDGPKPIHLADGWRLYYDEILIPWGRSLVKNWNAWHALDRETRTSSGIHPAHVVGLSDRFQIETNVNTVRRKSTISVGIKRKQRLAPILQCELIRAYSDYIARPARPHALNCAEASAR